MASREQSETILRQDIESAWEPYYDRETINQSQFSRRIRNAVEPALIIEYKQAAMELLLRFVKPEDIDTDELDELADDEMGKWSRELGDMIATTTARWVEDDGNPGRAFSRDRAELISITEITRARTAGQLAAASILEDLDILLDARWETAEDEMVCPVCGPLHKTNEKFWSHIFPLGPPQPHPRCRCGLSWAERKRRGKRADRLRKPSRRKPSSADEPEMPGRRNADGPRRVLRKPARLRRRSKESVQGYEIIKCRLLEAEKEPKDGDGDGLIYDGTTQERPAPHKDAKADAGSSKSHDEQQYDKIVKQLAAIKEEKKSLADKKDDASRKRLRDLSSESRSWSTRTLNDG